MFSKTVMIGVSILLLLLMVISLVNSEWFLFLRLAPSQPQDSLPKSTTVYAYGPSGLLSKQVGGEVSYYHTDYLSSSSLVTDKDGEMVYRSDYEPFGNSLHVSGEERYTYTGKELDSSTGLYYYGARYYDATLGRFISVDPVQGSLYSGQRLSRYTYVLNNPMVYTDPTGMESVQPTVGILVADLYNPGMVDRNADVNFYVLTAISDLKRSYQSQGYSVEGIFVLPQSGVVGEELEHGIRRDFSDAVFLSSDPSPFFRERVFNIENSFSTLGLIAHSYRDARGDIDADLQFGSGSDKMGLFYKRKVDSFFIHADGNFVFSAVANACIEVYGCALGGPGRGVFMEDFPDLAKFREYYTYAEILEIMDFSSSYMDREDIAEPPMEILFRAIGKASEK